MKKLILLFTIIFVVQNAKGQIGTDLQFSQTLLKCVEITSSNAGAYATDTTINIGIVPAGKIWKVVGTAALNKSVVTGTYYVGHLYITNNANQIISLYEIDEGFNDEMLVFEANFPIYFNENENLSLTIEGRVNSRGCISIVEYTVIP